MSEQPRVSVVVLNYNGELHLRTLLPSLRLTRYPDLNIIIVDNGSQDGSLEYLANQGDIKLMALGENRGFCGGNNAGIKQAVVMGAEIIVLLNNDTRVDPGWIKTLIEAFDKDPEIGICGSKILTWDGTKIEFDGTVFDPLLAAGGYVDADVDQRKEKVHDAPYVCGAALAIRTKTLRRIGYLDGSYFIYNEDVDLCLRSWIAGYRVAYCPDSIIYHHRGGSGLGSDWCRYVSMRNALTTVLKNYQLSTIRRNLPQLWEIYWRRGESHLRKALFANLLRLPATLIRRFQIQSYRKWSDHELFQRFAEAATEPGLRLACVQNIASQVTGEICGEISCGQEFYCSEIGLCRIDVFMATYNRMNVGRIRFHLRSGSSATDDLIALDCDLDAIQDNAYHSFEFDPISDSAGKRFYFFLESGAAHAGNAVTVWYTPCCSDRQLTRRYNHTVQPGALRFRAYTKRRGASCV